MVKGGFVKITLKKPKDLHEVLARGMNRINDMTENLIYNSMIEFARLSVVEAIQWYDDSANPKENLTGNTRASFCAAIYKDGECKRVEVGYKLAGIEKPYHYTFVGDKGFVDRGNGEWIDRSSSGVREYRLKEGHFIPIDDTNSSAYYDTMKFLESHAPKNRVGWTVVVASMSPYVEFIREWKHLDILETSKEDHKNVLREAIKSAYIIH